MHISKDAESHNLIDLVKFLMSVMIVAMHTQLFSGVLYPVTRLAVPVFFIISSYLFFSKNKGLSVKEKNINLLNFTKRNLRLYLFWFVVLFPLTVYIGKYYEGNLFLSALRMIKSFFFASTFQASWYITALIIGMSAVFFLSKRLNNTILLVIGAAFYTLACTSSNYIFIVHLNDSLHEIYNALTSVIGLSCRNFVVGIVYIVLGKIIAETANERVRIKRDISLMLVSFSGLIAESVIIEKSGIKVYDNDCFVFLVPVSYFLAKLCVNSRVTVPHAEVLRKISTVVYCAHMPVFMVVGKIFSLSGIGDGMNILVFTATILLSWTLAFTIFKLEKLKAFKFLKYSH